MTDLEQQTSGVVKVSDLTYDKLQATRPPTATAPTGGLMPGSKYSWQAARDATDDFKKVFTYFAAKLDELIDGKIWVALGHPTFTAWMKAEGLDRVKLSSAEARKVIKQMTIDGGSQRQIAADTGMGRSTVAKKQKEQGLRPPVSDAASSNPQSTSLPPEADTDTILASTPSPNPPAPDEPEAPQDAEPPAPPLPADAPAAVLFRGMYSNLASVATRGTEALDQAIAPSWSRSSDGFRGPATYSQNQYAAADRMANLAAVYFTEFAAAAQDFAADRPPAGGSD